MEDQRRVDRLRISMVFIAVERVGQRLVRNRTQEDACYSDSTAPNVLNAVL